MIKLEVKEFTGVKLKLDKKKDGSMFIDFTPIIKHANKLIEEKFPHDAEYVALRRKYRKLYWAHERLKDAKNR